MKIITLDKDDFFEHCNKLLHKIDCLNQFNIIIGIERAGMHILNYALGDINKKNNSIYFGSLRIQRRTTITKNNIKFLHIFPYCILNTLRKFERVCLMLIIYIKGFFNIKGGNIIYIGDALKKEIEKLTSGKILIFDDAIDSGDTILESIKIIKQINPRLDIKIAVITVTRKMTKLKPDYSLYDSVMIRFPWSLDYKGNDWIEEKDICI